MICHCISNVIPAQPRIIGVCNHGYIDSESKLRVPLASVMWYLNRFKGCGVDAEIPLLESIFEISNLLCNVLIELERMDFFPEYLPDCINLVSHIF